MGLVKKEHEIICMRRAGKVVGDVLKKMRELVRPGVTTLELDETAERMIRNEGGVPAFKGYRVPGIPSPFPGTLCVSINEEIVHGFPSDRRLEEGDIVSFDMGVVYEGFHGDSARTYPVGTVTSRAEDLMSVTETALHLGIEQMQRGNNLYDISGAVQRYVENAGFGVVKRFVGHGIGRRLHEKPEVPNFVPGQMPGVPLKVGMVLAIEPMVTVGSPEVDILSDKWTAVTKDRSLSAHFEHTVALTNDGPVILSMR